MKTIHLKVKRQDRPDGEAYWEEFKIPARPNMNVISALMEIQKNPVNSEGQKTRSVVWEYNCLEEVCGACSMVINGRVRQACSALIDKLKQPITLEPMSTFPVVKDLAVNRSRMFEGLKTIKGWVPLDGTYSLGPGPRISQDDQQFAYQFATCMTCGCCLEACPNVNDRSPYLGPQAMAQIHYFNSHPTGAMIKRERMDVVIGEEGIVNCGNSQNCVQVCPKEIPLTQALAELNKDANRHALKRWLSQ
ncbi:succinate dehydrogenase iron-sulfur subunit [Effusibacillus lacus]|uniref:succinate dehydrogenase n=1 Tax=Effusibacillus lacus TaxID=1348429 RepID=A0A292YH69_9BACL|nr:succinate dehydrogenase iron-sulfur subunit [Effusibacillus lacus]TCS71602.1 succinate dehydrogenase / fumarate reductase iron-sulfur subunit [Effusibacillus lacus]GAX90107.1 succinate dehydrogenase iron-sulfur subunit [Effusibacillus lacus]